MVQLHHFKSDQMPRTGQQGSLISDSLIPKVFWSVGHWTTWVKTKAHVASGEKQSPQLHTDAWRPGNPRVPRWDCVWGAAPTKCLESWLPASAGGERQSGHLSSPAGSSQVCWARCNPLLPSARAAGLPFSMAFYFSRARLLKCFPPSRCEFTKQTVLVLSTGNWQVFPPELSSDQILLCFFTCPWAWLGFSQQHVVLP